ncbi:hypothetical protein L1049_005278 [Liquidambar formosana]|uniref:Uncharacterized protein n=1 Tax=Liquidambar formosana TaxID=63359 RepID=A0AAP0RV66_LIQFO
MGCVVELQEAGVNFKKIGEVYNPVNLTKEENSSADDASLPALKEEKNVSLFEIRFENGSMKVPCFKVEDSTETLFRNLIAYEQHSSDNNSKYFTDFVTFMDQLINSEKDVEILRRNRIIVNLLGDDKMVSDLFSSLNKGIIESREFYYRGLCQRVNKHCKQKTNRFRAILTRDYLSTPCATASTFAAALLLILTIAQTIMALISLLKQ